MPHANHTHGPHFRIFASSWEKAVAGRNDKVRRNRELCLYGHSPPHPQSGHDRMVNAVPGDARWAFSPRAWPEGHPPDRGQDAV